jgi:hypothetical protein
MHRECEGIEKVNAYRDSNVLSRDVLIERMHGHP